MKPLRRFLVPMILTAALACGTGDVRADATVTIQSTFFSNNLTSTGQPLDSSFVFEIGCFANGFQPSGANTAEWMLNWVPLSDEAGDPVPGASVNYDDTDLGGGYKVNNFEISVPFTHNTAPFSIGGTFYVWGFDNRTEDGQAEWILMSDSTWVWPEATPNEPTTLQFVVADADIAVLGALHSGNIEMQTAAVQISTVQLSHYDQWLQTYFDPGVLEDEAQMETVWGVLADPDEDNYSNLVEYYMGTNPLVGISSPEIDGWVDSGYYFYQHTRFAGATGALARVEWSTDLLDWYTAGLTEAVEPGDEGTETVVHYIPLPEDGRIFMRLYIERVLEGS